MKAPRNVPLTVGKRTYTIKTPLEVLADRLSDAEGLRKAPSASGASGRAADEGEEASEEDRKSGFPAPR